MNFLLAGLLLGTIAVCGITVMYGLNKGLIDWTDEWRAKRAKVAENSK